VTKLLDEKDVVRLLREVVDKAGGQSAWARQTGVDRVHLNKVLRGKRPLTRTILQVLKLKKVYTATPAAQMKTRRGRLSGRRRGSDGWTDQGIPERVVPNCGKVQPTELGVMKANARNDHAAADIICGACRFVAATLHARK